ncbi:ABC transporter permease [Rapidithrix thailandica]|uniref:ABC transporter permease n=1 Tax=Rapidithrix thailandica TaxID=413964 RepID=A0AAW9SDW7_9BACT
MMKNYLLIARRNLSKNKALFAINVIGLGLSIATSLIIALFVTDELSYDCYNEKADQIFRVVLKGKINDEIVKEAVCPAPVAPTLEREFPEVLQSARLCDSGSPRISYRNKTFRDNKLAFVDPVFFSIFTLPFLKGAPQTALKKPHTIVITSEQAEKYFGEEDPIGKILEFKDWNQQYKVTGVIENIPANSHFHFDFFASMEGLASSKELNWVQSHGYHHYLLLNKQNNYKALERKLPLIVEKYMGPQLQQSLGLSYTQFKEKGNRVGLFLQPLTDIHLFSDFTSVTELEPGGDVRSVYIFSLIAVFIVLIACINFINLSTASASKRAKEVGIKKVLGSNKWQLIAQFLTESFVVILLAISLGVVLVLLSLHLFNDFSGKEFQIEYIANLRVISFLLLLGVGISLLAGSYPAFFLSSFNPISALKNRFSHTGQGKGIRNSLVIFQFVVSAGLIFATIIVDQQMSFIQNKEMGYDKAQIMVIRNSWVLGEKEGVFKKELLKDSRIESITRSGFVPVGPSNSTISVVQPHQSSYDMRRTAFYHVDEQYISTMGMELVKGRNFSKEYGMESGNVIINETAAKLYGFTNNVIGQTITMWTDLEGSRKELTVIGVVKDFHFKPLHQPIAPLIMLNKPNPGLIIRTGGEDMPGLISSIKSLWNEFDVEEPFTYAFLDDLYNQVYMTEQRIHTILRVFTLLTIFVACLGLFGLVTFSTEQRFKEIGIRKVLGSNVVQIVAMLSTDFLKLIVIAFLLAFPLSFYFINQWLQGFAYRIEIRWWVFLLTALITVVIAFLTISVKCIKAAMANPVDTLRDE